MAWELLYTSAPRGLRPLSRGLCTVAMTQGMPADLVSQLEMLSGYASGSSRVLPTIDTYVRLRVGSRIIHVISRISPAGEDYSKRSNHLAHHVALENGELPVAGPAWVGLRNGFMKSSWDGEVGYLPPRAVPQGDQAAGVCTAWQSATGDAGWAGALAEAFLADPDRPACLLVEPGQNVLPLLAEAINLLPPKRRWHVTYTTCANGDIRNECAWRCIPTASPDADNARRLRGALVVPLGKSLSRASGGRLVEFARTGREPSLRVAELPPSGGCAIRDDTSSPGERMDREKTGVQRSRDGKPYSMDAIGVTTMESPPPVPGFAFSTEGGPQRSASIAYLAATGAVGFLLLLVILGVGGYFAFSRLSDLKTEHEKQLTDLKGGSTKELCSVQCQMDRLQNALDSVEARVTALTSQNKEWRQLHQDLATLREELKSAEKSIKSIRDQTKQKNKGKDSTDSPR